MTSGGARVRSGPPPDPQALRRDRDSSDWTRIPSQRTGPTPPFPLPRPTKRELAIWEREWTRPQAVMWEAYGWFSQVAIYVRHLKAAENPKATSTARALLLRQEDALGISIAGLQRNRWIIAADDIPRGISEGEPEVPEPRHAPRGGTAKHRLGVIDGGA